MTKEKLKGILDKHDKWLRREHGGERADLSHADIPHADLSHVDLSYADLSYADLTRVDLSSTNLTHADLSGASLTRANLTNADLTNARLARADLTHANLAMADLIKTDLTGTYLTNANLAGAYLADVDLSKADYANTSLNSQCPEEGSFIAWKKMAGGGVAKLLIPEDAKRSSATSRKCRASKAVVLAIYSRNGKEISEDRSIYNPDFTYWVGETVYPDSWDENRWNECSNGIHFFITRKEAERY